MKSQTAEVNQKAVQSRFLPLFSILALFLVAACSAPVSPLQESSADGLPPQDLPLVGSQPPVILRVVDRSQVTDGILWYFQDIYFTDPDGDAVAMTYTITSSSLAYLRQIPDEPVVSTAEEQKTGALFTITNGCGLKVELTYESRIRDRAGNLSEPVRSTISCTAPQPLDTRPFLAAGLSLAFPIGLLLLVGFWLLFRKRPAARLPALQSTILLFFLFMWARFAHLVLHEGGHSLYPLTCGVPVTLYVHPFFFQGFSRPVIDTSIWKDLLGSATAVPVGILIFILFWKRRSLALLPLLILFPMIGLTDGFNVMGLMDDFRNLVQSTGLPAAPFLISGAMILLIGLISLLSLFPLAGLDPHDNSALFVLPTALFLASVVTFLVAHLFVVGSTIDLQYFVGRVLVPSANTFLFSLVFGELLAALYVTLFRKFASRLPAWLRNEPVTLSWKDLRIPGGLWAASVIIGLAIIIR